MSCFSLMYKIEIQKRAVICLRKAGSQRPGIGLLHFGQQPPGQQKIPETQLKNALIVPNRRVKVLSNLSSYQQIILEKQQLDVFSNPNTDAVLDQLGSVHEVILYGVVTEICVAYAAR